MSLKNKMVKTRNKTSTIVFQIRLNPDKTLIQNETRVEHLRAFETETFFLFVVGIVGNALGSEVLRVPAMRSDMRDVPSPSEWWILNIPTDSAVEVLMFRR